ncbi:MAG: phosphoribosylaminoimidazolesuccinocarboxamide synthase [Coriobacteriales bacterium]|jgi:phosphoribosylaminoimidazole-succinocarboxamide synthase|nr:phosphoribosylaminoimidazolesuccinocarboxamide synthase [Coriobacteriales bacterium]
MTLQNDIAPSSQGKVRDLYDLGDQLLFIASDRISAFDYVLEDEIPFKGEVLTRISLFWFELLADCVPNHLISADVADLPEQFAPYADELAGRFMLVKKAQMFPVECIVRGYLAGSGLKEYERAETVCGLPLPAGLVNSSKLEEALYTPSTKAEIGEHDENVSFEQTVEMIGEKDANALRELSLLVYGRARDYAAERGIIIADTKFEFGVYDGTIVLADEVLTPDSSRFWPIDEYEPGKNQPSFDKQFVRDWLDENWDRTASPEVPPRLPAEIIEATSAKYIQAYEQLTGEKFVPVGKG